ncbi:hypothetical protein ABEX25_20310 [Paenibacillus thiaminolyticus]|uniref:hypothetical protein n=1 Tax=Paenibacillus thiaminolyticus TaxID=49283 RepID=UPI003D270781
MVKKDSGCTQGEEGYTGRTVKLFITDACLLDAVPKLPSSRNREAAFIAKSHNIVIIMRPRKE